MRLRLRISSTLLGSAAAREKVAGWRSGLLLVIGVGAALFSPRTGHSGLCGHGALGNSAPPAAQPDRKSRGRQLHRDRQSEIQKSLLCRLARRRPPETETAAESGFSAGHKQCRSQVNHRSGDPRGFESCRAQALSRGSVFRSRSVGRALDGRSMRSPKRCSKSCLVF